MTALPPIKESILIPLNLPNLLAISWTWCANSLVLTMTMAWMRLDLALISLRMGIKYAAVLPVPFLALAMIDLRCLMRGMDYYWIGVGLLNPSAANANRMFSSRFN